MITRVDVNDRVMEWGLRDDIVDKDYILGWVFKGGSCLKKCYFETYCFSEDLDFTVINNGPETEETLRPVLRIFQNSLRKSREGNLLIYAIKSGTNELRAFTGLKPIRPSLPRRTSRKSYSGIQYTIQCPIYYNRLTFMRLPIFYGVSLTRFFVMILSAVNTRIIFCPFLYCDGLTACSLPQRRRYFKKPLT